LVGWKQICCFLQCSRSTARRFYKQGMPISKPGGKIPRAWPDELRSWLKSQR
jgi:phage terminase Nu1 subunit (DNA packaging protein)